MFKYLKTQRIIFFRNQFCLYHNFIHTRPEATLLPFHQFGRYLKEPLNNSPPNLPNIQSCIKWWIKHQGSQAKVKKQPRKHRLSRFFIPNEGELPSNGHSYPTAGVACLFRNCSVRPARMHINRLAHPNRTWNRFMFLAMPRYATFLYPKSRLTMRKACSTLQRIDEIRFSICFSQLIPS